MIQAKAKSWFAWGLLSYRFFENGVQVGELNHSLFKTCLMIGPDRYTFHYQHWPNGFFRSGAPLITWKKNGVPILTYTRRVEEEKNSLDDIIPFESSVYSIEARTLSREHLVRRDGQIIGSIKSEGLTVLSYIIDLPKHLPIHFQLFLFYFVSGR